MSLAPAIAIHLTAALGALLLGPVILWTRRGARPGSGAPGDRRRWHRATGYAWITLVLLAAFSALFIRSDNLPNVLGYSAIHLLVPFTLGALFLAMRHLVKGNIAAHRRTMLGLYLGACVGAGTFTLLPQRYLGQLIWGQWLGWL